MMSLKKILFGILMIILWLPLLQMATDRIKTHPLKGAFTYHSSPKFSDSTWFDGSYQMAYELFSNDSIGFHDDFIILRNQVDYSIFNKCHSYDIEIGKDGYLIATTHVDAAIGKTKMSDSLIDYNIRQLAMINDTLAKLNKTLIILLAPNRGNYFKEFSPSWYDYTQIAESDHLRYSRKLAQAKVKFIDYDSWFLSIKQKHKFPLYTKTGIHWSNYGAVVAADTLIKFIEGHRNIDMPDMKISKNDLSLSPRHPDGDLNDAINLIWDVKNDTLAYPVLSYDKESKVKPSALFIGDSYFFNISIQGIINEEFGESSFWYYNKTIFSLGQNNGKNTNEINFSEEINKHDVIAIMSTDINLPAIGWGFINNAYNHFYNNKNLEYYKNLITKDPVWYATVLEKAKARNVSVDEQLNGDAAYAMDLDSKKLLK